MPRGTHVTVRRATGRRRRHRPGDLGVIRRPKGRGGGAGTSFAQKRGRGIVLLPSLLTTGNLFCGFFALLLTVDGRFSDAALAIFVAMVMDLLDGRVARLMKATSQFGVGVRLAGDVVSLLRGARVHSYSFALKDLPGRPAWFGAFLFVICGALRLARFNVQTGTVDRRFFIGLSTPAAAGVVASVWCCSVTSPGAMGADRPRGRGRRLAAAHGLPRSATGASKRSTSCGADPCSRSWSSSCHHHDRGHQARACSLRALHRLRAVSGPVRRVLVGRTLSAPAGLTSKNRPTGAAQGSRPLDHGGGSEFWRPGRGDVSDRGSTGRRHRPGGHAEAVRVLRGGGQGHRHRVQFERGLVGGAAIDATGKPLAPARARALPRGARDPLRRGRRAQVGRVPHEQRPERGLPGDPQELDLYANLRPGQSASRCSSTPRRSSSARWSRVPT